MVTATTCIAPWTGVTLDTVDHTVYKRDAMSILNALFENEDRKTRAVLQTLQRTASPTDEQEIGNLKAILKRRWDKLQIEPTDSTEKELNEWRRRRGYQLERVVFELLWLEVMNPSAPYYHSKGTPADREDNPDGLDEADDHRLVKRRGRQSGGEQIDGFFELDGRYFLLEAKWHGDGLPASQIYEFRGKVEGKLSGTLGVILSIPGFAEDVESALMWGKHLNVILLDGDDMAAALEPGRSFREMMRVKLRHAARVGQVYYSYATFLDLAGRDH